ncbi:MAG: Asp-tRNA(Asn)/Glu-tRNA(Gln) amidotransferase subunit GatC [Candidatus Levyibacteriota bacterium]
MKIPVKHIARLSHFTLSKKQEEIMEKSIPAVVTYMDEIKNLDVDRVRETNGVTEEKNVTRDDAVEPSFSQEEALKNATHTYKGFFVVPYVFEEDDNAS